MVVCTLEQHWAKWACYDRLPEDTDFGKKKIIFSNEAHFDLGKIVAFGAQKTRTHTLKYRRIQNEVLFAADFGPDV